VNPSLVARSTGQRMLHDRKDPLAEREPDAEARDGAERVLEDAAGEGRAHGLPSSGTKRVVTLVSTKAPFFHV
jgi:hypothetical protein